MQRGGDGTFACACGRVLVTGRMGVRMGQRRTFEVQVAIAVDLAQVVAHPVLHAGSLTPSDLIKSMEIDADVPFFFAAIHDDQPTHTPHACAWCVRACTHARMHALAYIWAAWGM